ncbi:hypothetical protein G7046_g952 [Stylonectria norvegica]|nr:hypothetical protein G7046_g952 [Stylonectria norvegica]
MSDNQQNPPADENVGWEERTSQKGQSYRVKASDYDISEKPTGGDAVAASGPKFSSVPLHWTVGSSGSTSDEIRNKTAITWYKLDKAPWYSVKKYRLSINTEDTYDYEFFDEEPDEYGLNVWQTAGTHTVEFDSERPTIVSVSGT